MTAKLCEALAKAQAEMKAAPFNRVNPHFKSKYADLSAVLDAVRPALTKHGLSVTQTTRLVEGGGLVLVTTLHHASGESIASEYPLPIGKPQEMGSALTYARRYTLSAICCIAADEDDDANAAEDADQRASKPKANGSPVKPVPVTAPPADKPHAIPVPVAGDMPDWLAWGGTFVAAIKGCKTPEQITTWLNANEAPFDNLRKTGPEKVAKRVDAVVKECLAATSQAPQEAA